MTNFLRERLIKIAKEQEVPETLPVTELMATPLTNVNEVSGTKELVAQNNVNAAISTGERIPELHKSTPEDTEDPAKLLKEINKTEIEPNTYGVVAK